MHKRTTSLIFAALKLRKREKMKKILMIGAISTLVSNTTFAGDYLTNTNQHAAFLRMVARGASIDVDGVYSNPAGLSFLPKDGFHLSLTGQSAYQTRSIAATTGLWTQDGSETTKHFKGTASAPIIPSFQGVYKRDRWTISTSFAITGGGGKASFDNGLPMFNALAMGGIYSATSAIKPGLIKPDMYDLNTAMDGKQYIYGVQLGIGYRINDWLSVFAGGRMNYVKSGYEGHLEAQLHEVGGPLKPFSGKTLVKMGLDCEQSGWGMTPIIGANVKLGKWNLAAKYEFITNLNIENKTKLLEISTINDDKISGGNKKEGGATPEDILKPYADGEQTPNDIPAFLSVAAQYEILPTLRASVEYHFFDDKHAKMLNDRQKTLKHGTHEYLGGIEWDVIKRLTISGGFQKTSYGLSDDFQTDTSFYCSSYSLGCGARMHINENWTMDLGYFWTKYKDYTKNEDHYYGKMPMKGSNKYSRTNKVFGLSLNYNF